MLQTLLSFIAAIAILIAIHEFGHFWVARKAGVKVLRFSIGFGTPIWRYQKSAESTEFVLAAIPLGGYVKMVDEREGAVEEKDLAYAFNRQSLSKRVAIVAAGPLFNLFFAVFIYWVIFFVGETGMKPVLGPVAVGTLAEQARLEPGDEILSVEGDKTPTWELAVGAIISRVFDSNEIRLEIIKTDGTEVTRTINVPAGFANEPDNLNERLGIKAWRPVIDPVIDEVVTGSPAEKARLMRGDRIISADNKAITTWDEWVDYVRIHPERLIELEIEREGMQRNLELTPEAIESNGIIVGRIGASVSVSEAIFDGMKREYSLGLFAALSAAVKKTTDYSLLTLKMMGRMLVGEASIKNLSGPISIAKYAGASAAIGFAQFMKFLAIVSISLGILNLLPIPVLDGGHLFFYLIEAIKGSPVSESTQAVGQRLGMAILFSLMAIAVLQDVQRIIGG
ncbi:MAG: RIP metalloprotease RseP [Gammaproteobacteria bacterium]|nr:MAG: RIP metalloprotease RseP [Gammaproteobacteria bacterium]